MRVISGFLKGRIIKGFDIEGTRPTMDRVKESLFAMIQDYVKDGVVLDLFSGSGNLGIEAISNGCKKCYFNDINRVAIKTINENLTNFNINDKSIVINKDYNDCLDYLINENIKFNLVFLDPPYKEIYLNEIIDKMNNNCLLSNEAIIVCEVNNNYISDFVSFEKIKEKKYGDKWIVIFKRKG